MNVWLWALGIVLGVFVLGALIVFGLIVGADWLVRVEDEKQDRGGWEGLRR